MIEILLNISLAFMIMARSCMWIFYVKFYKKNYKYPTDKEGNWAPFSFLCQNINMYYENPVCYRDLQIHSDVMEKDFGIYQYINTYKAPRNGKTEWRPISFFICWVFIILFIKFHIKYPHA